MKYIPAIVLASLIFILCVCGHPASSFSEENIHLIDVHVHYSPLGLDYPKSELAVRKGWDGMSVSEFNNSMDRNGIDKLIIEMPPTAILRGGIQTDFGIPRITRTLP